MPIGFNLRGQGSDSLELDLYEGIGADPLFGGGISAQSVLDTLSASPKAKKIRVRINSGGGIVTEGLAIYNILKNHTAEVTCQVDGLAGSIASVIAMSGRLEMPATSYLMIHNPYGWIEGGSDELRHQADVLDSMREMMLDIYCAKCGRSREFIGSLMNEEKWMTGTEALAYGFADSLIQSPNAKLAAHFDLSMFRNVPRSIDAQARASTVTAGEIKDLVRAAIDEIDKEEQRPGDPVAAALEQLTHNVTLGDATTDELTVTDSPAAIAAAAGENTMDEEQYKARIAELEAQLAEIKAQLDTSNAAKAQAEADAAEAKAKFPKKGNDDEDEDDDESAATKAVIEACVSLTGCKDIKKLAGAVVGHADKLKTTQTEQTVAQRVTALIKSGQLRPDRKVMALKMTHEGLDGYLEMTGGAKFGPVNEEHEPDDEHETVVEARASTKKPAAGFNAESIQLTAEEKAACKLMGGVDKAANEAAFLADKRARAKLEHDRARGIAA